LRFKLSIENVVQADVVLDPIPFDDSFFDSISAFDFIEHIPRFLYAPGLRFPFVELMNEIQRCLKKGGRFVSFTQCYPSLVAFQNPTHVNIITQATFPVYFCEPALWAKMYGFKGMFELEKQNWNKEKRTL
jgi:SAM-dependent methyltransferase